MRPMESELDPRLEQVARAISKAHGAPETEWRDYLQQAKDHVAAADALTRNDWDIKDA